MFITAFGCQDSNKDTQFKPVVYLQKTEDGHQLMRNGKPFYMKGGAAHSSYLKELREAGANTARIYDTINLKQTLDKAEALGLAVVVDLPMPKFRDDPEFYEDPELFEKMKNRIKLVVRKNKDHPALLYWNLGNELFYPYFYKNTSFHTSFNILIDLVHELDPNHPVSTVTIGANKLRVLSIHRKSPDLDFISFNSFGILSTFSKKLKPISPIWSGPHVITEWGVNGSWEAQVTSWKAPIEENSTKKAEQIKERYYKYIEPLKSENSLGSFVFYWGQKNEVTPTWYSLFGLSGKKTQAIFELSQIWNNNKNGIFKGPELDYLLINEKGAFSDIILIPGTRTEAEVVLPDQKKNQDNLKYHWEIRNESWDNIDMSRIIEGEDFIEGGKNAVFKAPEKEGPYRLFVYLTDESDYFATANIPFYVLKKQDGDKD